MEGILNWIIGNKEWLFSGVGVFVLGLFLYKKGTSQKQSSGPNSINIQSGGDTTVGDVKND